MGIRLATENMPKSDWLFFNKPDLDLHDMGLVLDAIEDRNISAALEQKIEQGIIESLKMLKKWENLAQEMLSKEL